MAKSLIDRFWERVNKTETCWVWTAGTQAFGHGMFSVGTKHVFAHRYSWEIHNGAIPTGLCVLHHCDNPPCVNPDHLFLGTRADNNRDRDRKGRACPPKTMRGENHYAAKFTVAIIQKARHMYEVGSLSQAEIGRQLGIRRQYISAIVRRTRWAHVT